VNIVTEEDPNHSIDWEFYLASFDLNEIMTKVRHIALCKGFRVSEKERVNLSDLQNLP